MGTAFALVEFHPIRKGFFSLIAMYRRRQTHTFQTDLMWARPVLRSASLTAAFGSKTT